MSNKSFKKMWLIGAVSTLGIVPVLTIACGDEDKKNVQPEINDEQLVINALDGPKKFQALSSIQQAINQPFTSAIAAQFGITGFNPKDGFSYVYSHPSLQNDGNLLLTILVKINDLTATNFQTHTITVIGLDLEKARQLLINSTTSSKTRMSFMALSIAKTKLDFNSASQLGLSSLIFPASVVVEVAKVANSSVVSYFLSKLNQDDQAFEVTFVNFTGRVTQNQVNNEQQVINALGGTKSLTSIEAIAQVENATFDEQVATKFGLTFTPQPDFSYTYSHPALASDGNLALSIQVKSAGLVGTTVTPHSITVQGIDLGVTKTRLTSLIISNKTSVLFDGLVIGDTNFDQTIATQMGVNLPTFGQGVTVRLSKVANSKQVNYVISKSGQDSQTFVVTFTGFTGDISAQQLDDEQTLVNNLGGLKTLQASTPLLVANDLPFTTEVATRFGINNFSPNNGFTYVYSHPALDRDASLSLTITVRTDRDSTITPLAHTINVTGIDLAVAQIVLNQIDESKIGNIDKTKIASNVVNASPTINNEARATITNVTPHDGAGTIELTIEVTINGKHVSKTLTIFGFALTETPATTIVEQGENADTQAKWETYIDALAWSSEGDKQLAKDSIDWTLDEPVVKDNSFSNIQDKTLPDGFTLPKVISQILSNAFFRTIIPSSFKIPSRVLVLNHGVFFGATLSANFTLPDSIIEIRSDAFSQVVLPKNFKIPVSVRILGGFFFATLNEGFTIPASVTTIDASAFEATNIGNLRWVYLDANGQPDPNRPAPGPEAGTILIA